VSNIVEHDSDRLSEAVLQMWPEGHDVMVRNLRTGVMIIPSDKLLVFIHSRDEGTSGG